MSFLRRFFSSSVSTASMEAAQKKAQQLIADNGVIVFSKTYCPYCRNTKRILDGYGAKYQHYELDVEGRLSHSDPPLFPVFPGLVASYLLAHALTWAVCPPSRRRRDSPGRPRAAERSAECAQHLHRQEAHRRRLRPAGREAQEHLGVEAPRGRRDRVVGRPRRPSRKCGCGRWCSIAGVRRD